MKMEIPKSRLAFLAFTATLIVGVALALVHYFTRPGTLSVEEALWVKKDGVLHAPGSEVSSAVIDLLHPDYVNFDGTSLSGPVILLYDNLTDAEPSSSRSPLVIMPYDP